ncbi:phosphoglycerate dehydrogenase [Chloroflexota bacterium]
MRILVTDNLADPGVAALRAEAEVDVRRRLSEDELVGIIGDYDALVVRSETRVTARVIEAGSRLVVVGRAGVGVDNIDLEAATRRGVVVVNAPAGNTVSAAEHTLALLLALARHIPQANACLRGGEWRRDIFMGTEVRHKTVGIIGLGRVGVELARRAQGLEMHVIAHDPFVAVERVRHLGIELVSKEELLKQADFITVHTPLTKATRGVIGEKELALVKPTVYIINTARGGIIDEQALYQAVESGRVAGAAVDVFTEEPARDNILCQSEKIIVTPHLAASTAEAQTSVAVDVAEQVVAVLKEQPAKYAVNVPLIQPDTLAVLEPFFNVASYLGRFSSQLTEGQLDAIAITYEGEIAGHDMAALKAAIIGGLLESVTEERVNIVNASAVVQSRGLKVTEHKRMVCENYSNLITVEVTTNVGQTVVAGSFLHGAPHIVRVGSYWLDFVPGDGYWLFANHRDRPGLIAAVSTVAGNAGINISSMLVFRLKPRGEALMVLGMDEALGEEHLRLILAIPDMYSARLVRL